MFKTTRVFNQKALENLKVEDSERKLAATPGDILDIVSTYSKVKFVVKDEDLIPPFQGATKSL